MFSTRQTRCLLVNQLSLISSFQMIGFVDLGNVSQTRKEVPKADPKLVIWPCHALKIEKQFSLIILVLSIILNIANMLFRLCYSFFYSSSTGISNFQTGSFLWHILDQFTCNSRYQNHSPIIYDISIIHL